MGVFRNPPIPLPLHLPNFLKYNSSTAEPPVFMKLLHSCSLQPEDLQEEGESCPGLKNIKYEYTLETIICEGQGYLL